MNNNNANAEKRIATFRATKSSKLARAYASRFFVAYTLYKDIVKAVAAMIERGERDMDTGAIVKTMDVAISRDEFEKLVSKYAPQCDGLNVSELETDTVTGNLITKIRVELAVIEE